MSFRLLTNRYLKESVRGYADRAGIFYRQKVGRQLVDLRVEDHLKPMDELSLLVQLHAAYDHMNAGDAAMREYVLVHQLAPDKFEILFGPQLVS